MDTSDQRITPVICDDDPAVMRRIHDRDVAIATWRRQLPHCLTFNARRLLAEFPCLQLWRVPRFALHDLAQEISRCLGVSAGADVTNLAAKFMDTMNCDSIIVRLEHVTGDACRKFHADYRQVRLITTYVGPGTQWTAASQDLNAGDDIHQLNVGDVGLFKGRTYPGYGQPTVLHRSPPISKTGVDRLLLVIDVDDNSDITDDITDLPRPAPLLLNGEPK